MKTLILYTYCENQKGNFKNKDSKDNLLFFLNNGLINNDNYRFCINVSGAHTIDFIKYQKVFTNLKIYCGNGKSKIDGWINILNDSTNDYYNYDYYYFIGDKVAGPYNKEELQPNWIEHINRHINDKNVIIGSYGTSPHAKLYKFPYYTMKFFCINKKIFKFLIDNNIFNKLNYDTTDNREHTIDKMKEIRLSYIFLDNNIRYESITKHGLKKLEFMDEYKNKDWEKLFLITKNLHSINDIDMKDRIFWTGTTMHKVFTDKKYHEKILIPRNTDNLDKW